MDLWEYAIYVYLCSAVYWAYLFPNPFVPWEASNTTDPHHPSPPLQGPFSIRPHVSKPPAWQSRA